MNKREAGQKGGLATKAKYGERHFHNIGRLGGRPPLSIIAPNGTPGNIEKVRELSPVLASAGLSKLKSIWESHPLNSRSPTCFEVR